MPIDPPAPPDPTPRSPDASASKSALIDAFLRSIPDAVYFKDRESRFIALSQSLAEKVGVPAADLLGKTDFDVFAEDHARPAFDDEQAILRTGKPLLGKLEKETFPDGEVAWVITNKLPLLDEQGRIFGTFGTSKDITATKRMEIALEKTKRELQSASRLAGLAEVATSVLHNLDNLVNSLNVSSAVVTTGLRQFKLDSLTRVAALMKDQGEALGDYIARDPKGRLLPEFLTQLAAQLQSERARLLGELGLLQRHIDHIKDIVAMQQDFARLTGGVDALDPVALLEDAIHLSEVVLSGNEVQVVRDFRPTPAVRSIKGKVLQVLVCLIRNAKDALEEGAPPAKVVTFRVRLEAAGWVSLAVADNGVGVSPGDLGRVFQHGFITRKDDLGFSLNSAAEIVRDLGGILTVQSEGRDRGATFTLRLPAVEPAVVAD